MNGRPRPALGGDDRRERRRAEARRALVASRPREAVPARPRRLPRGERGQVHAVDGVSFEIPRGGTLGLVGESGCGKSTVARLVTRLLEPTSGTVAYDAKDITHWKARALRPLRREMQLVFQDPYSSLNPRRTVGAIVAEPLRLQGIGTRPERRTRVREMLEVVGLNPEHYNRYPHEFSGGQRQRDRDRASARSRRPSSSSRTSPSRRSTSRSRRRSSTCSPSCRREFGLTYLFIAHDLNVVRHVSDRIAVMYLGKIVELSARGRAPRAADPPVHARRCSRPCRRSRRTCASACEAGSSSAATRRAPWHPLRAAASTRAAATQRRSAAPSSLPSSTTAAVIWPPVITRSIGASPGCSRRPGRLIDRSADPRGPRDPEGSYGARRSRPFGRKGVS